MMAESKLAKDLQDNFLQCAICMEGYKNPRMLPCIHSFCVQCLQELEHSLQYQPFSCPTCRRAVTLPENGVKDLPNNFLLVSLMERIKLTDTTSSFSCYFCEGEKNIQLCLDCQYHICSNCRKVHDKISDIDDHTIIPVDKLGDTNYTKKILATQVPRCTEHIKEKLRFYCIPCSKLVCLHCTIINHRGHECIEAEKRFAKAREVLEAALRESQDHVKSVQQISDSLTTATENIKQGVRGVTREVEGQYDKFVERLKSDKGKLINVIEKLEKQEYDPLTEVNDGVRNWTEAMKNTQTMTKMILEAENQWEILEVEKNITDAFRKLCVDQKSLQGKQLRVGKFHGIEFSQPRENRSNVLGGVGPVNTKVSCKEQYQEQPREHTKMSWKEQYPEEQHKETTKHYEEPHSPFRFVRSRHN